MVLSRINKQQILKKRGLSIPDQPAIWESELKREKKPAPSQKHKDKIAMVSSGNERVGRGMTFKAISFDRLPKAKKSNSSEM